MSDTREIWGAHYAKGMDDLKTENDTLRAKVARLEVVLRKISNAEPYDYHGCVRMALQALSTPEAEIGEAACWRQWLGEICDCHPPESGEGEG